MQPGFRQFLNHVRIGEYMAPTGHNSGPESAAEVLQFVPIPGDIPNRGLLQADIELHGLTYLQKINDAHVVQNGKPAGIHIEPGIWISVPPTSDPQYPGTVARLANIPHGTSLVAQGTAVTVLSGPQFAPVGITPFVIGQPNNQIPFPEQNLSVVTAFRTSKGTFPTSRRR